MAIKAFNSVAGFSVGENPTNIILANGDITTSNASISGNVVTFGIYTDHYYYANGTPLDFQMPAGSDFQLQFGNAGNFDSTPRLVWNPVTNTLEVGGKITASGNVTAPYFIGNVIGNISGNIVVPGLNKAVLYNDHGIAGSSDALIFDEDSNVLTLNGDLNVININASANISGLITTAAQPNITSLGTLTTLNVTGLTNASNIAVSNNIVVSNNANVRGNLRVEDTATIRHLIASGLLYPSTDGTPNQVIVTDGQGNLGFKTIETDRLSNGSSNIQILQNSNIKFNISGVPAIATITPDGVDVIGTITATTYISANNAVINKTLVSNNITLSGLDNTIKGVSSVDSVLYTGSNISISDTITTSKLRVTGGVISDLAPDVTSTYDLGSTNYKWNNIYLGANLFVGNAKVTGINDVLTTANANVKNTLSANVLSVSTEINALGNVTISGNLTVGGSTEYINVSSLSIKDPLILLGGDLNGGNSTVYDGKDRGLLLQNYKPDGSGVQNQFFGWKSGTGEFVASSNVTDFAGDVVTQDRLANIRASSFIGNLSGTVTTSSQPQITSLGTLTGLTVSGSATIQGSTAVDSLTASGIAYPTVDGQVGQVLTTNGSGAIYFSTPVTSSISNGTSNISVVQNGNVNISAAGTPNVAVISSSGLKVNGNANVTGNIKTDGNITATGNVFIGLTAIRYSTTTTTSTLPGQVIASVPIAGIRGVEFFVKGEESLGSKYSVASVSVVHNGFAVDYSVYGTVTLGGSTGVLNVAYNGSADAINLTVTPASSNSTVWTTQFKTI